MHLENSKSELANSGRIFKVPNAPHVANRLSVPVQWLILDLRHVNQCLMKRKVKYEDWSIALAYYEQNAYMFSFDLKSGYHRIDIFGDHQKYLGFSWRFPNPEICMSYYVFPVLPFGLSTAPHIFTKVVKPLEKHCRYIGIKIAIFLDDSRSLEKSMQMCDFNAQTVRQDLISAGFVPNDKNSIWKPTQSLDWFGLTWNFRRGIVSRRIQKITGTIKQINELAFKISARQLAYFVGQVIPTGAVI